MKPSRRLWCAVHRAAARLLCCTCWPITSRIASSFVSLVSFCLLGLYGESIITTLYRLDTTRKARNGEEDGNAYYFVDAPTFKQMIAKKEFVEYAEFSGNFYGTRWVLVVDSIWKLTLNNPCSRAELTKVKNSGRIPILDVDLRGVQSLKAIRFDAKYLFITAPTFDSLVCRQWRGCWGGAHWIKL